MLNLFKKIFNSKRETIGELSPKELSFKFLDMAYMNEDGVLELTASQRLFILTQPEAVAYLDGTINYCGKICK